MISKYYKKILFISILLTLNLKAQPFLFDVQIVDDSTLNFPPYRLDKIDLSNGSTSPFININEGFYTYELVPSNDWIIIIFKECDETVIYNILDTTNYFDVPSEVGCFGGGIQYSANKNKIYYFESYKRGSEQLTSIDMLTGEIDSLLIIPTSYNQPIGNLEAFLSSNEDILYFNVMDTTYPSSVNDKDFVHYFSTASNQLIQTRRLYEFGYPNADGYLLHRGRNGKAVVESFYRNQSYDSYYRLYDFDNDSVSSVYVFYQGYTTPYFTGEGNYLVLPEEIYSSNKVTRTGTFYIYDFSTSNLLKTIALPSGGEVYTFDNYPNNIYYVIDIEKPTRQIYTLKMDSIFNVLDLTSLDPSSEIVGSPPFTLTVNGHGFDTLSTVYFNDIAKTTTFISDSVLTVEILTTDISVVGNYPVWVRDEWRISDTLIFEVNLQPPVLTSISPAIALRVFSFGTPPSAITATATGDYFTDSSVVYFNGSAKTTNFVSETELTFQLSGSEVSTIGNYPVWVNNYSSNSDTLTFSVVDNLPQSLTPTLQCVRNMGDDSYWAYFGYNNNNSVSVYVPLGSKNKFAPIPIDRGQPKLFLPGNHTNVFIVVFNGKNLTWTLDQTSITANKNSTPCP